MRKIILTVVVLIALINASSFSALKLIKNNDFKEEKELNLYKIKVDSITREFHNSNRMELKSNGFSHVIFNAVSPEVIGGINGEWFYIEMVSLTIGEDSKNIYVKFWINNILINKWVSNDPIESNKMGRHIYPIVIEGNIQDEQIGFRVETGHIEDSQKIKDDEKIFTSKIGKKGAVLEQMSTIISTSSYLDMTPNFCPFFRKLI